MQNYARIFVHGHLLREANIFRRAREKLQRRRITLLDLHNSCHTRPRSTIASYAALSLRQLTQNRWVSSLL